MEMDKSVVPTLMIHARARLGLQESTPVVLPKVGMKRPRISISFSLLSVPLVYSFYHHVPHSLGTSPRVPLIALTSSRSDYSTSTPTLATPYTEQPSISAKVEGGELLSLGVDGLGEVLGGHGRAKMVWNALAAGMDPFSDEGSRAFLTPKTVEILRHAVEELPWQVNPLYASIPSFENDSCCWTRGGCIPHLLLAGEIYRWLMLHRFLQGTHHMGHRVTGVKKKCGWQARRPRQGPDPQPPSASIRVPCSYPRQVVSESVSRCGTRKLLIRLKDDLDVETVVIPCLTGTRWASVRVLP